MFEGPVVPLIPGFKAEKALRIFFLLVVDILALILPFVLLQCEV